MFSLTQSSSRQREIIEIVLSNGWDYMKGVLTGRKSNEPKLPPPEVFRKILVELGPFYVKFGQLLSTRPDLLPPKYIEALTALQASVPPVEWDRIKDLMIDELNQPLENIFSDINPQPVAAGSIAQIHKGILITGEEVAIKVQRPYIDRIVTQDINLIKGIAELIALTDFGNDYDVVSLADEFTKAVKSELDFRQEGNYTERLKQNLSQSNLFNYKQLTIPKIYWDITTQKILVMEWLNGKPILEAKLVGTPQEITIKRKQKKYSLISCFFPTNIY